MLPVRRAEHERRRRGRGVQRPAHDAFRQRYSAEPALTSDRDPVRVVDGRHDHLGGAGGQQRRRAEDELEPPGPGLELHAQWPSLAVAGA